MAGHGAAGAGMQHLLKGLIAPHRRLHLGHLLRSEAAGLGDEDTVEIDVVPALQPHLLMPRGRSTSLKARMALGTPDFRVL